jgi:hypothetical protein
MLFLSDRHDATGPSSSAKETASAVFPANAGTHRQEVWAPAFAGET